MQFPDGLPVRGESPVAPVWCVEVVSPEDREGELREKMEESVRAGVALVWVVSPATRTIRAEQPDGTARTYRAADSINAAPVLPGLAAKVADFFPG